MQGPLGGDAMLWQRCVVLLVLSMFAFTVPGRAADGQILINHAKALAGNVTPGDAPGYPVTLTKQGSYILGSDLSTSGADAIEAFAVEITIDLNGFRIEGSNGLSFGINSTQRNLTVRNGTIQRFLKGIVARGGSPIIENMRITENRTEGIQIANSYGIIRNSTIILTRTGTGIDCVSFACQIEETHIAANATGVKIKRGSLLNNMIIDSTNTGISLYSGATVGYSGNTLINNAVQVAGSGLISFSSLYCQPTC